MTNYQLSTVSWLVAQVIAIFVAIGISRDYSTSAALAFWTVLTVLIDIRFKLESKP